MQGNRHRPPPASPGAARLPGLVQPLGRGGGGKGGGGFGAAASREKSGTAVSIQLTGRLIDLGICHCAAIWVQQRASGRLLMARRCSPHALPVSASPHDHGFVTNIKSNAKH